MSDHSTLDAIRQVTAEVRELHAGQIGTHYSDCWIHHVACLAGRIERIAEEGVTGE